MKKIYLIYLFILIINLNYAQRYHQKWGDVGNINGVIKVAAVNPKDNNLYFINDLDIFSQIQYFDYNTGKKQIFYSFPRPTIDLKYASVNDKIMFDNQNNLIVYGRTHNPDLGTNGTYAPTTLSPTKFTGYTFIAKIDTEGKIVWFTYFHDLLQNKNSLTIDNQNNIYVLNMRHKTETLSSGTFQPQGDLNSQMEYQTVISKISPSGKHLWSTFYFNDDSDIYSIEAGSNGLYVYGTYNGNDSNNHFFSSPNSFQRIPGNKTSTNNKVFLSKFNFNGQRDWSTYYGEQTSLTPESYLLKQRNLLVINDDVYILTKHMSPNGQISNMASKNSYISTPLYFNDNTTLTKFKEDGTRAWSTYLVSGNSIIKSSNDDIIVTGQLSFNDHKNQNITSNSHQSIHGGTTDIYISIISKDGKKLNYGSYYGFEGGEFGEILTCKNGYYIFGNTYQNKTKTTGFSTSNQILYGNAPGGYWGRFVSLFETKYLNNNDYKKLNLKIYPNPVIDNIYIDTETEYNNNAVVSIFDISGKLIFKKSICLENTTNINVSNLPSSIYVIEIKTENNLEKFKFIKN